MRQRTAQLQAANKELEAFSYSIAHDLCAPLSSIDGFSLMLEQTAGKDLAERCRHYLNRIRVGVKQMGELTDGLLSLTNLSRASLRSEAVDLAALARAAAVSCRERSPERDAVIDVAAFDMAYASRMFEAFQRMHTPTDFEGTGIGLAIVHKISRAMVAASGPSRRPSRAQRSTSHWDRADTGSSCNA